MSKSPQKPDPDRHGQQRIRRATLTGITTLAVRGVSTGASLLSIPLTAHYLGTERFGLWLTLSMLLNWVSLTDLGLANSLTNVLSSDRPDSQQTKQAVSSAFWLMVGLAIALTLTFFTLYPWVRWDRLFNVTSAQAKSEVGWAAIAFFVGFILRLPLSVAGRIYTAYQEGYFYQAWGGLSSLASVVALVVAIQFRVGLPQLVMVFFGTSLLGDLLATLHVFGWRWRSLRPQLSAFNPKQAKWLLKVGLQFWVIQISSIIFFQTDLIIVAQLFGAEKVATYGTVLKLFTLLGTIQTAFLFPLWPAYSEAFARKDVSWIIQTFRKTIVLTLLWSISTGVILAVFTNEIISFWLNQTVAIDASLIPAMFVTTVLLALGHCLGTLLNGMGIIKSQVIFGLAGGVANIVLSIALGHLLGVAGICWATAICLLIFPIGIIGIHTLKILQKLKSDSKLINSH
ncbi:oligosaccharide flippase family protein [Phormidesmis priestleyi]